MEKETDFESGDQLDEETVEEKNLELGVLVVGQGFESFLEKK